MVVSIRRCFSALQRAEIAEIGAVFRNVRACVGFSALQRAEIAEIGFSGRRYYVYRSFSALQRAEIAEIQSPPFSGVHVAEVSVLFNEPKLLK